MTPFSLLNKYCTQFLSTRVIKFGGAGGVGMIVDNLVLIILVDSGNIAPVMSKIVAALFAILVTFLLNERYTYSPSDKSLEMVLYRYLKSNLVRAVGVTVAVGILYVLHNKFGLWYVYANFIGIIVAFFVNYINETLFTWRVELL